MFLEWLQWLGMCYVGCTIVEEYYISHYCYFSAVMSPSVATSQDSEIPALEYITNEEVEAAPAGISKETTPKGVKLKVPRK